MKGCLRLPLFPVQQRKQCWAEEFKDEPRTFTHGMLKITFHSQPDFLGTGKEEMLGNDPAKYEPREKTKDN